MEDFCNSLHWKRSVVDSPLRSKESPVFGLAAVRPGEDFQFGANNSLGCSFSSPLDWNEEQLRYLMEGDNGDSGDHVVPYPFQSERNVPSVEGEVIINQYDAKEASNVKSADRKKTFDLHNIKHTANEALPASAFDVDSWPALSMSKTDQDLSCALESENAAGTLDGTGELDSDSAFFQKLDGNVSNMEILDDIDKILSNYNPDFCQTSLPSTQLLHNQLSTRGCENMNDFIRPNISQAFPEPFIKEKIALESGGKAPAFSMELDTGFDAIPDSSLDEVFLEAHSKSKEEHEANQLQDLFRYQPISFDKLNNQYISMNQPCPSAVLPQQMQPHYNSKSTPYPSVVLPQPMQLQYNTGSMPYPGPDLASSVSMDFASQFSMPGLSQFRGEQVYHQSVPCSSYVSAPYHSNSLKMSSCRPIEGLAMTPKRKVEKLRKQQQMRGMLAIQKLQQQFCDKVVSTDHSVVAHGNFFVEGKSQLEQNDSNIVNVAVDDHPVEESTLYQLQEIIQKLDTRVKVNIRDSFFRLAQNARQRQNANNTSGMNTDSNTSIVNKEDINNKVETETNLIDRAVAHLLFHQPLELPKNLTEIPGSQLPEEFYYERNPSSSLSFAR